MRSSTVAGAGIYAVKGIARQARSYERGELGRAPDFVRKRVGSSHHKRASINTYAELDAFRAAACYVLSTAGTSRTTGVRGVNAPSRMSGPARKILLATDLSARCDRALCRAAMLAAQWRSSLIVLHVVEDRDVSIPNTAGLPSWRRPPDPLDIARKHLLADVDALPARPTVRIAEGNPVETILCNADAEKLRSDCNRHRKRQVARPFHSGQDRGSTISSVSGAAPCCQGPSSQAVQKYCFRYRPLRFLTLCPGNNRTPFLWTKANSFSRVPPTVRTDN